MTVNLQLKRQQNPQQQGGLQIVRNAYPLSLAQHVARVALEGSRDLRIIHLTRNLIRGAVSIQQGLEYKSLQIYTEIAILGRHVPRLIRYTHDPFRAELVEHPRRMMDKIAQYGSWAGDCDDITAFAGAMALSIDIPTRFKLISRHQPKVYDHIFPEMYVPQIGWLACDCILNDSDAVSIVEQIVDFHIEYPPEG